MTKSVLLIGLSMLIGVGFWYYQATADFAEPALIDFPSRSANNAVPEPTPELILPPPVTVTVTQPPEYASPLNRPDERITKKPFGIHITPATSPIQPEKFSGYHTGTDFEILDAEANTDVMVHAFCSGSVLAVRTVNGYGGVVIQSCTIEGAAMTALYGHLDAQTVVPQVGEMLNAGDSLALLGDGYSDETDGERKHLHLAVHRGEHIEYLGYVSSASGLDAWIDSQNYF